MLLKMASCRRPGDSRITRWLVCDTQDQIAEAVGWPQPTVHAWLKGFIENRENGEMDKTDETEGSERPFELTKEQ
jgi:hypothetical protein